MTGPRAATRDEAGVAPGRGVLGNRELDLAVEPGVRAAALQAAQGCDNPTLIRIETRAGHGAGKPTSIIIKEVADKWAFLVKSLDMSIAKPDKKAPTRAAAMQ